MLYSKIFKDNGDVICYHLVRWYLDRDGGDNIILRVENEKNMDVFSEWRLPDVYCMKSYGFDEYEIDSIKKYIKNNEVIMWDM